MEVEREQDMQRVRQEGREAGRGGSDAGRQQTWITYPLFLSRGPP